MLISFILISLFKKQKVCSRWRLDQNV